MRKLRDSSRHSFVADLASLLFAMGLVISLAGVGQAYMLNSASPSADKTTICHSTGSVDNNPYEVIEVSGSAWKDDKDVSHIAHVPADFVLTEQNENPQIGCLWSDAREPKVTICHVTGSETNPYETIEVAGAAWTDKVGVGHKAHDADNDGEPDDFELTEGSNCPFDDPHNQKVTICHATGSATNPYEEITVSGNAWTDKNGTNHAGPTGHAGHEGDFELTEEECPGPPPPPECDDDLDNDGDGATDFPEAGCDNKDDDDESNECSDGIDNDGDGATDFPELGCDDENDDDESNPECSDDVDNDGDGATDYPEAGCDSESDDDESNECSDGADNDEDGFTDYPSDEGCEDEHDDDETNEGSTSHHGGGGGGRRATPTPTPTPEPSVSTPAALPARPPRCSDIARQLGLRLVAGTRGPDVLRGTDRGEVLCGKGGKDRILGGGGNDIIWMGPGNDFARGGKGNDRIRGQRGADIIFGDKGSDVVTGGGGPDDIQGGPGPDQLYGQEQGDGVHGGPDDDSLYGGPGQDTCTGGAGRDKMGEGCESSFQ